MASQSGTAKPMLRESCVVGVNVYGRRPNMFRVIRKIIKEANRVAHLWPPRFIGRRSCWVKRLINQPCRVNSRLLSQRVVGVGKRIQGKVRASIIRGIPRSVGLIN